MGAIRMAGTLKVGIAPRTAILRYTREVATGRRRREPDDPDVWFTSVESFAKILSEKNRDLLALIAERQPDSIEELASVSGRAKSNLSRTLRTMERHGLVRLVNGNGRKLRPVLTFNKVELRLKVAA
ncbi:MAG: MarR family transcriptional regulator [Bradyrhizobiaceae bacterium]|nr:MarR family transcriptional regulator [Bradyrhizobiaceae bacterium]